MGSRIEPGKVSICDIKRLRLNRPPLIALRQARKERVSLRIEVNELRSSQAKMQEQLAARDEQIKEIAAQLTRLLTDN